MRRLVLAPLLLMAAPVHAAAQAPGADFGPAPPLERVTATTAPRLGAIALDTRRLAGTAVVTGTGPPGARIDVRAPCAAWTCHAVAPVRADRRWTARLLLVRPARRSAAVVSAGLAGQPPIRLRAVLDAGLAPAVEPVGRVAAPPVLTVVGDSLAQGTRAPLEAALPGWEVRTDAQRGRPLAQGMALAPLLSAPAPAVLAFGLFTNDDPRRVDALEQAVRASVVRAGLGGCAIWATVVRPKVRGRSSGAANARLAGLAADPFVGPTLRIVPWAAEVARHRSWLARDRVHATTVGYAERARLFAEAVASCPGPLSRRSRRGAARGG